MGLQHILKQNLEPDDEYRELLLLRVDNHRQLGNINHKLYNPNLDRKMKIRLEIDRAKKEKALKSIDNRVAELTEMLSGQRTMFIAAKAEGSA